ncbi:MAG: helix-hairpin-helix domain-containing protein, partial [Victivallaceae bacterium]|nr:helix-hairpin-helix domain-containing protein [Victivallaceae bacterium]
PKGSALKTTMDFLLRHFGLRGCRTSDPDEETRRHCLKRTIKDCCGPCIGNVTPEEYRRRLDGALKVLAGDITPLREKLRAEMAKASAAMHFETAAKLRDISANLEAVFGHRTRTFARPELPENAPGNEAVLSLARNLGLEKIDGPVIGFDISNILGTLAVASLVCFTDGRPDRGNYRRFRIKTVHQSDDFAMMKEAVTRHFRRLLEEKRPLPGLLLVDGGKGQLSSAVDALVEIGCPPFPVLGLAKKNEEIFLPGRSEPILIDRHDPAIRLLQALRDEAHRFAITFHRNLRQKALEHSVIDEIPGIGEKRKFRLLREFGGIKNLKTKTAAEIAAAVPGIGETLAQKLLDHLRGGPPARSEA